MVCKLRRSAPRFSICVAKECRILCGVTRRGSICAANAICHIPDLTDLIKGIDKLLSKKGIFIFEEPYLGSMYQKTSYDQIYDEHFYIFSANSIRSVLDKFNLELVSAERIPTHGGSMRYYVKKTKSIF